MLKKDEWKSTFFTSIQAVRVNMRLENREYCTSGSDRGPAAAAVVPVLVLLWASVAEICCITALCITERCMLLVHKGQSGYMV